MIVLTGKTTSGKDTVKKILVDKHGLTPIVTYTTRPMRPGEIDGVDYHFISKEEFLEKRDMGFFAETTEYHIEDNTYWYYGTSEESLKTENGIVILNPDGLYHMRNRTDISKTVFYIAVKDNVLWDRLKNRGGDMKEAKRRLNADAMDFDDIEDYYNYAITNNGNKSATIIAEEIWLMYKTEKMLLEDLNAGHK